jgi:hypothetical protein
MRTKRTPRRRLTPAERAKGKRGWELQQLLKEAGGVRVPEGAPEAGSEVLAVPEGMGPEAARVLISAGISASSLGALGEFCARADHRAE